jgi:hypothetical protein
MKMLIKSLLFVVLAVIMRPSSVLGQNNQTQTQLKVKQLIEKRAEYARLTNGEQDGYRIKIHFGGDRENAKAVKNKFLAKFTEYNIHEEYQQPNFVVLVGDFRSKLEAFESLKNIQAEFPNSFIVKSKIKVK